MDDLTLVNLPSNFFVLCTNWKVNYIIIHSGWGLILVIFIFKEAVGLPRAEPLRTDVSEVRVHVQKSDHRFIVGQQRRNIEEIYNLTGVKIEVPGMNDPSEEIVLHGDRFQIGSAITLMYTKVRSPQTFVQLSLCSCASV